MTSPMTPLPESLLKEIEEAARAALKDSPPWYAPDKLAVPLSPPTALALVSAARRGEKMEELLRRWNDWFEAGQDDMECRMDENCDHCVGKRIFDEARYALKPGGE